MIPRIGRQGHSFKGAALYYLHDKQAQTNERVAFTETRNLPTVDPELAWRLMVQKARDAERLKHLAGAPRGGRKSTKPVWTMSLAWHPEQQPSRAHMTHAMDSALAALGLQDHQTFYVAHTDTEHPHIHAVVSLVHPETGRTARLSFSKLQVSRWSENYEREFGIYCDLRVENNEKRRHWAERKLKEHFPTYQPVQKDEPEFNLKAEVEKRYHAAESGYAFVTAMREVGYEVAAGKRPVLVGPDGSVHSIARLVDGIKVKDVQKKLLGIELPNVSDVRDRAAGAGDGDSEKKRVSSEATEYFDRDAYQREQDERIIDAGIEHAKGEALAVVKNRTQDRELDEWGKFYEWSGNARLQLGAQISENYGSNERTLRQLIQRLEGIRWRTRSANERLEDHRMTLRSIEQRKVEMSAALESRIETRRAEIDADLQERRSGVPKDLQARQVDELLRGTDATPTPTPAAPEAVNSTAHSTAKTYEQLQSEYFNQIAGSGHIPAPSPGPGITPGAPRTSQSYETREAEYLRTFESGHSPAPEHNPETPGEAELE